MRWTEAERARGQAWGVRTVPTFHTYGTPDVSGEATGPPIPPTSQIPDARVSRVSADELAIRGLVQDWAVWRDAGDWERFATVWHDDGVMMATWFQGPAADFIRVSREGFERGVRILHFLGGTSVDLSADRTRAIAQTKMTITQRTAVHDVECDVVCTGRFYDFLEKRDERWGIWFCASRSTSRTGSIPVSGGAAPPLDPERLSAFPVGYRHLAYIQTMHRLRGQARHAGPDRARGASALRARRALVAAAIRREERGRDIESPQ